ncbi:hypothetical protein B0H14DRAFT_229198 [Mycena olivaceomarginata]|nr:hypothetical protein B0H14DRAFT_229198 [Mycena olivaceomarginata]
MDTLVRTMKDAAAVVPYLSAVLSLLKTRAAPDCHGTKGHVGALTSEATIATFLAAIQAQLVAISYQDNSTRLKVATNALGFAGLLMGVISACLALLASNILQRHIAIVDKQLTAIETATAEQLDDLTLALTSGRLLPAPDMFIIQRRTTEKMVARFTELQRTLPNAARAQGNNAELNRQTETAISGFQGPDIRAMAESLTHIRGALSIGIRWRCHIVQRPLLLRICYMSGRLNSASHCVDCICSRLLVCPHTFGSLGDQTSKCL